MAFLQALQDRLDGTQMAPPPQPLLRAGIYWPDLPVPDLDNLAVHWQEDAPVVALIFLAARDFSTGFHNFPLFWLLYR